jgi:S1-C subfamily serine protease
VATGSARPLIAALDRGSPAERAGLQVGDVVVRVGDRATRNRIAAIAELESAWPGDRVRITVLRQTTLRRIILAVAPRPGS